MTRSEFAARIKQKHPVYASLGDDELVEKVLAKHPQYQSQIDPEDSFFKPLYEETVEPALNAVKENLPYGAAALLGPAIAPLAAGKWAYDKLPGMLQGMQAESQQEWDKSLSAQKEGELPAAAFRGATASVPFLGPMAGRAADALEEGRPKEAAARALAVPITLAGPKALSGAAGKATSLAGKALKNVPAKATFAKTVAKQASRKLPISKDLVKAFEEAQLETAAKEAKGLTPPPTIESSDAAVGAAKKLRTMKAAREASKGVQKTEQNLAPTLERNVEKLGEVRPKEGAPLPPPPSLAPRVEEVYQAVVKDFQRKFPSQALPEAELREAAVNIVMDEVQRAESAAAGMGTGLEGVTPGSRSAPFGRAAGPEGAEIFVDPRGASRGAWRKGQPVIGEDGVPLELLPKPPGM